MERIGNVKELNEKQEGVAVGLILHYGRDREAHTAGNIMLVSGANSNRPASHYPWRTRTLTA